MPRARALFLMPPFSKHAARRNWLALEDFYNPMGVFEQVLLVSLGDEAMDGPADHGSLHVVPLQARPRRWTRNLGPALYGRLDPVAASVLQLARDFRADLLVYRYGGPLWHGLPIVWAAKVLGVPSIVTFQNDYAAQDRFQLRPLARLRRACVDRALWRIVIRDATVIWSVSDFVTRQVIEQGAPPDKIVTIPNKDSIDRFEREPAPSDVEETLAKLGLAGWTGPEDVLFLAVGRLVAQKNWPRTLEAFERVARDHPSARLLIVGQGEEEPEVRARIERAGLGDCARLVTRYISAQELWVLYHSATALLFATLHEGQGRVLYEAMACGTPVIGSDCGPIPEMLEHERNGLLVDPLDVAAIAAAMERFCRGELTREAMGPACRETGRRYDLSRINPLEAELYRRVLAAGR